MKSYEGSEIKSMQKKYQNFLKDLLILGLFIIAALMSGCAGWQTYNYEASLIDIPGKPPKQRTLILSVEDLRPFVLSGDKEPNFVGLQRGGFGEPWDVTTASGKPMTEDMSAAIAKGLKDDGYIVVNIQGKHEYLVKSANKNGASRIVVLKVFDWKSDVYMGITLHCNLHLSVFDVEGKLLAESNVKSMDKISRGSWATRSSNSHAVAEEFAKRVRYLFNKDEVQRALQ